MKHKPELVVIGLDGTVPSHIKKMMDNGELPAFQTLTKRGCWFNDCRPPFPTITPTCWASFSTGATPATHGAVCQDIHLPGYPLDKLVSAYHSANIHAERFWEAAARIGKHSLIIQMPTSGPSKVNNIFQIYDDVSDASSLKPTATEYNDVPAQLFVSNKTCGDTSIRGAETPGSGQWKSGEGFGGTNVDINADNIAVLRVKPSGLGRCVFPFDWYVRVGENNVKLAESQEALDEGVTIAAGQWTETLERSLSCENGMHIYRVRAKLFYADREKKRLKIFFTSMDDVCDYASPKEFADNLIEIPGVAPNCSHHDFLGNGIDLRTFLEVEAMNFDWQWETMQMTWEKYGMDITVGYSVYIDSINHLYRNVIEGIQTAAPEDYSSICQLYDDAYRLADGFLARIVEYCGPETTIVVVSDHGSVGYDMIINPFSVLEDAGLLAYNAPVGTPDRTVDWKHTVAYPVGTCHVFVNLKGRDPHGIAEAADYDKVVQKIIGALQAGFKDDKRGNYPLAFALRREEAGLVGLGGEFCGDVIYGLAGGKIGGYIGGVHACQIPTAKTKTGDVRSLLIISGPQFKPGERINRPVNLYDAAPTLCYALNYPQPRQVEGAVIFQALRRSS